ncbi:hypothetical protein R6Q59_017504 [Mikania micrantha]|uniref:J domain-containing protein n=1 Tax=Mikania micrantha TaxID=192012 RepID=A0A5N6M3H1_9ASTR|nr:hypothetical protein E3N88_36360 [Mikania micrantha]
MNCNSFHSAPGSISNSSHQFLHSTLPSNALFKFKHTHVTISPISIRSPKLTTRAAAINGACTMMPVPETLYDLLGVSENGTLSDIKHAYKKMALKYHPDVSPPDRAEEYTVRFIRVQEAYETLSDPESRSIYDSCMEKGLHFAFSGKRETRVDPRSDDKKRWKETWKGQISELMRRSGVGRRRVDPTGGMSWAARIRKQRSQSGVYGSDSNQ